MRELVIKFYKQGLYKKEDLLLFVKVTWISEDDYKSLTGQDYFQEV